MTERPAGTPIEILLAEDNPGDVRLTEKALDTGDILNTLHVVDDGVEAMAFLRSEGEYEAAPRPDLFLLDLNMPRMDGQAVLEAMAEDESLRRIPVVVLTSSEAKQDILDSYDRHANAYLTKPVDFDGFVDIVQRIEEFWLTVVKRPPR
ncbi:response regulator [Haloarcula onubensis]|uniref:Response regulator n=1 Tax=Haloarcula onubensis TaxID=2950539 RepID=A0ABU2FLY4_9EURY|nr:response regulator [Halomicroarcula sp. S3CR25-11]MDS0281753.1 response regulator [Halomicroarcula sp. S3CR25-11]